MCWTVVYLPKGFCFSRAVTNCESSPKVTSPSPAISGVNIVINEIPIIPRTNIRIVGIEVKLTVFIHPTEYWEVFCRINFLIEISINQDKDFESIFRFHLAEFHPVKWELKKINQSIVYNVKLYKLLSALFFLEMT